MVPGKGGILTGLRPGPSGNTWKMSSHKTGLQCLRQETGRAADKEHEFPAGSTLLQLPNRRAKGGSWAQGQCPWGQERWWQQTAPPGGSTVSEVAGWLQVWKPLCPEAFACKLRVRLLWTGPKSGQGWEREYPSPNSNDSGMPQPC